MPWPWVLVYAVVIVWAFVIPICRELWRGRIERRKERVNALVERARSGDRSAVDEAIGKLSSIEFRRIIDAFYHEGGIGRTRRPTAGGAMSLATPVEPKPHDPWLLKELLAGLEQGGPEQVQKWLKLEKAKAELGPSEVRRDGFIYYEPVQTTQVRWWRNDSASTVIQYPITVLTTTTNST